MNFSWWLEIRGSLCTNVSEHFYWWSETEEDGNVSQGSSYCTKRRISHHIDYENRTFQYNQVWSPTCWKVRMLIRLVSFQELFIFNLFLNAKTSNQTFCECLRILRRLRGTVRRRRVNLWPDGWILHKHTAPYKQRNIWQNFKSLSWVTPRVLLTWLPLLPGFTEKNILIPSSKELG